MKILALETSGLVASVALVEDGVLVAETTLHHKKTHSQTLMPMLAEMAKRAELDVSSVDAIAVSEGPGSFTGLRIGSGTAKGMAMALQKPIVAVPTLEALCFGVWGMAGIVCPIMDARRSQVYTAAYRFLSAPEGEGGLLRMRLHALTAPAARPMEEVCDFLNEACGASGEKAVFVGDGIPVCKDLIAQRLSVPYLFAPPTANRQRAACVAALGAVYFEEALKGGSGPASAHVQEAASHAPVYLRPSQAERVRKEREEEKAVKEREDNKG